MCWVHIMEKDTSGELVDSAYCLMSCLTSLLHLGMIEMRKDDGWMMGMILLLKISSFLVSILKSST